MLVLALHAPDKAIAGVQRVSDLALPVIVVCDEAGAARALVGYAATQLASPVYLRRGAHGDDLKRRRKAVLHSCLEQACERQML